MIQEALIKVQDDLASRIAIRYARGLGESAAFLMKALHIPDFEEFGGSPGSGWVQNKWKDAVVENSGENVAKMVKKEAFYCYSDTAPLIVSGRSDRVVSAVLNQGQYGFFIEGMLHSFEPDRFFKKIGSDLYRKLPCPALLVKNLTDPGARSLIIGTEDHLPLDAARHFPLISRLAPAPDLIACRFQPAGTSAEGVEKDSGPVQTLTGAPEEIASMVRDYGLVIAFVPDCRAPLAKLLSIYPGPILFLPDKAPFIQREGNA